MLCGSWPREGFGTQLTGSAVLAHFGVCTGAVCLGTNMIFHLAPVFYQAMFVQKMKLDPSVKNGNFSEVKTWRRVFFLPVFFVLSFPAELSKCLGCGCGEGVFQVDVHVLVFGGARLGAARSHCFPCILWCCLLTLCKAGMLLLAFLILYQELLRVVRKPEIMRMENVFLGESLF